MLQISKGKITETDSSLAEKFISADFGFRQGGVVFFSPLEAAYLVSIGKTAFEKSTLESFLASQKKKDKPFLFAFAVYSRLRSLGRVARPYAKGTGYLQAWSAGVGRLRERPSQLVALLPGEFPSAKTLQEQVKVAHLARLDLIIACGTEKEIWYYKISSFNW